MATPEMMQVLIQQLANLTNAMTQQQQRQQQDVTQPPVLRTKGGKHIDIRHFRTQMFSGAANEFDDWAFAFKRTIRSANRIAYDVMVHMETISAAKVEMEDLDLEFPDVDDVKGYSAELYDLICQSVSGEALTLVRSVSDMEGASAWNKLFRKYNPKTMARAIRLVGQVTNPPKIKDLQSAEAELDKWEDLVKVLGKDFKEFFSDTVRVGIVTTMMPVSIKELIYTTIGAEVEYDEVVHKIRAVISNKVAMATGPCPMDVGKVEFEDENDYGYEEEVGAVSMSTQCHGCQGWGHLRRDCPTVKGQGKGGEKGKGKGKGDWENSYGHRQPEWRKGGEGLKGQKGAGKGGFKGACFKCGKPGHRAVDCHVKMANAVEEEFEEVPLGGVWMIGNVEDKSKFIDKGKVDHGKKFNENSKFCTFPAIRNRYQCLTEDEEEEVQQNKKLRPPKKCRIGETFEQVEEGGARSRR
jgi:hypothetical protein